MARPIDATNLCLEDAIHELGWRCEPSLVPGHVRIYDSQGVIVNILMRLDAWEMLEERGLVTRKKETA